MSLLTSLPIVNLLIRFLIELGGLAIYCYWGYQIGQSTVSRLICSTAFPVVIAMLWAIFGSPKAIIPLHGLLHLAFELLLFLSPIVILVFFHHTNLAWIYGLIYVINRIFMALWKQ